MTDVLTIQTSEGLTREQVTALLAELENWEEIDAAGPDGTRADAATVGLWVETLSGIISMVGTGVPLLKSLFGALGRNGAKTATIELPNGVKVTREMDDEELARLVRASSGG